jgi:hypothetical protein
MKIVSATQGHHQFSIRKPTNNGGACHTGERVVYSDKNYYWLRLKHINKLGLIYGDKHISSE